MIRTRNEPIYYEGWKEVRICSSQSPFPYHIPSGEIFNPDPKYLIRIKCTLLIVATPIVSVVRSLYAITKAIFFIFSRIIDSIKRNQDGLKLQKAIYLNLTDSFMALSSGFLMSVYAVKGIWDPFSARQAYGRLERNFNRQSDGPHTNRFYLAFCFQPLGVWPLNQESPPEDLQERLNRHLEFRKMTFEFQQKILSYAFFLV